MNTQELAVLGLTAPRLEMLRSAARKDRNRVSSYGVQSVTWNALSQRGYIATFPRWSTQELDEKRQLISDKVSTATAYLSNGDWHDALRELKDASQLFYECKETETRLTDKALVLLQSLSKNEASK